MERALPVIETCFVTAHDYTNWSCPPGPATKSTERPFCCGGQYTKCASRDCDFTIKE